MIQPPPILYLCLFFKVRKTISNAILSLALIAVIYTLPIMRKLRQKVSSSSRLSISAPFLSFTLVELARKVERDADWNHYAPEAGTLRVPRFSKTLLLSLDNLSISTDSVADDDPDSGSCVFQLMSRLGLLPGQDNEARAEYDAGVPLKSLISRNNCYCGRISRHGLVFLISKYFQNATLEYNSQSSPSCAMIFTAIGRFKFYEIEDRTFVHFDGSTRSTYIDLVPGQKIDHIIRSARGQYMIHFPTKSTDPTAVQPLEWHTQWAPTPTPDVVLLATHFVAVPDGIVYMSNQTIEKWKAIKRFAAALLQAILWVIDHLTEPQSFVDALCTLPDKSIETIIDTTVASPAERLARCVPSLRWISSANGGSEHELGFIGEFSFFPKRPYPKL